MYPVIFAEIVVILMLLFRSPLRKILIKGLKQLKFGKGQVVAQTLLGTLFVLFISSLYALFDLHGRYSDAAALNPTDQVLMVHQLLESTLLGICLFLALMIDRLHYYMNEIKRLREKLKDYEHQYAPKTGMLQK
ncbi:unnamed protein product [Amaranthus hypochondriacus]